MSDNIYTTFCCTRCLRSVSTKGSGSWVNATNILNGSTDGLHYVTFVSCWKCSTEGFIGGHEYMTHHDMMNWFMDIMYNITEVLCPMTTIAFHTVLPGQQEELSIARGERISAVSDTVKYPIMDINTIRQKLVYKYTASSVVRHAARDPYPDFFSEGPTCSHT